MAIRDDRISLIANDLVVPDFSQRAGGPAAGGQPADPAMHASTRSARSSRCWPRHPGTSQVHLRLISGERITTLELDQSLRVTPSSALMGDLKALLGPGCLG